MSSNLWNCVNRIVTRCGLDRPDGRPLYAYRVSLHFLSLTEVLKSTSRANTNWPAAFVMFAAEWWRREYSGGAWSWTPILEELNIPPDRIPALERSQIVKDGLDFWRRAVRRGGGNQNEYLLSIILEGGLPLRRFKNAHAGSDKLLPLLQTAAAQLMARRRTGATAQDIVQAQIYKLPTSLQRDEFVSILAAMVDACVGLREKYDLHDKPDPVAWLTQSIGEAWKWDFPLNMDEDSAKGLLETLVREVSSLSPADSELSVQRTLVAEGDGLFRLRAHVALPKTIARDALEEFGGRLESQMALVAIAGEQARPIATLGSYADDVYRVRNLGAVINDRKACSDILLRLENTRTGETVGEKTPAGGASLEDDLPWVFTREPDANSFLGQGNVSIKDETCLVVLDQDDAFECEDSTSFVKIGRVAEGRRDVFRLEGTVDVLRPEGRIRVRTGQETVKADEYALEGRRLLWPSRPAAVFTGFPRVTVSTIAGKTSVLPPRSIVHRLHAGDDWRTPGAAAPSGVVDVAAFENGLLLFRRRAVVLPPGADISLRPGHSPQTGTILFRNFGAAKINAPSLEGLTTEITRDGETIAVELTAGRNATPATVDFILTWPGQAQDLILTLPFPACGARLFDGESPVGRASAVFAEKLHGIQARIFNQAGRSPMRLSLSAQLVGHHDLAFWRDLGVVETYSEVRLIHYVDDIRQLFAATSALDGIVRFTIIGDGRELERLDIRRYEAQPAIVENDLVLSSTGIRALSADDLRQTFVDVLPLWLPERAPERIEQKFSASMPTGFWPFDHSRLFPGPWMIYPDATSAVVFRPTLCIVPGEVSVNSACALSQACLAETPSARAEKIDSELEKMTGDACRTGWMFFQNLLRKCGHLPLNSMDLFVRAATRPHVMAQSVLQIDAPDFDFTRFSRDMPFMWERVSCDDWQNAFSTVAKLYADLPSELRLYKMREKFSVATPFMPPAGLEFLRKLYEGGVTDLPASIAESLADASLKELADTMQAMLRDICDQAPPNHLAAHMHLENVPPVFERVVRKLQDHFGKGVESRRSILLAPVLLGMSWLTGASYFSPRLSAGDATLLIRECKSFHPDWFSRSMDCIIFYGITQHCGKKFNVSGLELRPPYQAAG